jgi:hypothetical protein
MSGRLLLGFGRFMIPIPAMLWRRMVRGNARKIPTRLSFMSEDHHRVRDFVVTQLPRAAAPIGPQDITEGLGISPERVRVILADLERHLTFLFRSEGDAVTWAYPVTVEPTPHHAVFSTGEEAYSP